jgi:O-antigen ligase
MRPLLERFGAFLPAAVALALPTLFIPTAVDSFILPRAAIVIGGACVGVGLALLTPGGPGLGRMGWPIVAVAAAAILAFLVSVSPALSFAGSYTRYESLPVRLGYVGLFAAAAWLLGSQKSREWVVAAFVFGTAVASLEAVQQWASQVAFRPDGNLGNANLLAALATMGIPLAIWRGLRWSRFVVAWWAAVAVMTGGLAVTTSRSGLLGTVAACLALAVFALRGRLAVGAAVASAAAIGAGILAIVLSPLNALNDDPAALRLHLWQDGIRMVVARPLAGWGEDTTGLAFGRFLSQDYASQVTFDRIHSGLLDFVATQGLIGLAALGWLLLILFVGIWRNRRAGGVGPLGAACVGYSVWVLFNFDWAPATGVFWLLAGTTWSAVRAAETGAAAGAHRVVAPAGPSWWRSGLAVALGLTAVLLAAMPVLADVWYSQNRADLAVRVDPLQARYHWSLGEGLIAQGQKSRGVDEMLRAADLGETEPSLYVEIGDAQLKLGRGPQARDAYRRALAIDPFYAPAIQRLDSLGA